MLKRESSSSARGKSYKYLVILQTKLHCEIREYYERKSHNKTCFPCKQGNVPLGKQ